MTIKIEMRGSIIKSLQIWWKSIYVNWLCVTWKLQSAFLSDLRLACHLWIAITKSYLKLLKIKPCYLNGANQSLSFTSFSSSTGLKPNTSGNPIPTKYSTKDLTNYTNSCLKNLKLRRSAFPADSWNFFNKLQLRSFK